MLKKRITPAESLADKLRRIAAAASPENDWVRRPESLLHPNLPKPLHGLAPRLILGSRWWDNTRKSAYEATNHHCIACGIPRFSARYRAWLEGHEVYSIDYRRAIAVYQETVALCHSCHCYIHNGRLRALVNVGRITVGKLNDILAHGDRVLRAAGLDPKQRYESAEPIARWNDWRMVINGVEYRSKFNGYQEWARYHERLNLEGG